MTMTLGQSKQKRVLKFLFENWFKTIGVVVVVLKVMHLKIKPVLNYLGTTQE